MGRWLKVLDILLVGAAALAVGGCDDSSKGGDEPCTCPGGGACDINDTCPDAGTIDLTCSQTSDCPSGQLCDEGVCRSGCQTDDECSAPERCNPETSTCRNECPDDAACPDGYACVTGACSFGACRLDGSTCGDDQYCDVDARTCMNGEAPPPVMGPCCLVDTCAVLTADACAEQGGSANEADSCDPNPCAQPCQEDGECDAGSFCTEIGKRCAVGCRIEGDDCPDGQRCGDEHQCIDFRCGGDGDCAEGEYCLVERGTCEGPCADDASCPDGYFCQGDRCANTCRDGDTEPNDDAATADPIALDQGSAAAPDGRLCPLNADWFSASLLQPGERLRLELSCEGEADLALALYDEDGNRVARSNDEGCVETITWPEAGDDRTGRFLIEVTGATPQDGIDYALQVTLLPPEAACAADEAEPDDDPATATHTLVRADTTTIEGRTACAGNADFFAVPLGAGDGLRVDLTLLGNDVGAGDDLTFDLLAPGSPADAEPGEPAVLHPNMTAADADGNEVRSLVLPRGNQFIRDGNWLVRVRGSDPAQYGGYDLTVTADRNGTLCLPDEFEPNDGTAAATDLMPRDGFETDGVLTGGIALIVGGASRCAGDADFYRVVLAEGDRLNARVTTLDIEGNETAASGAISVAVVNADGEVIGLEGREPGPEINAISAATEAGVHYVRVAGDRTARAAGYRLTLIRTPGDAACADDRYDGAARNDEQVSASPIEVVHGEPLEVPGVGLCGDNAGAEGDVDWYTFTTAGPGRLQVDLSFMLGANGAGDLDLELFRDGAAGAVVADLDVAAGARVLVANAPADTWYIRVSSFAAEDNAYDLTVDFTLTEACDPDAQEPDDERGDATEAGAGFAADRWICRQPADDDWYEINVPPNTDYTFHLAYLRDGDGWIVFDVYDADGAYVTTIDEALDAQCVVIDGQPGGSRWFFQVVANTFRPDAEPDRAAYHVDVVAGDQCAQLEPLLDQVEWPHL